MLKSSADQLILNNKDRVLAGRVLLVLTNGTALASHLTQALPDRQWDVFTFEHFYHANLVNSLSQTAPPVQLHCSPDLPAGPFDTIILPTSFRNSSELARDLLQQCRNRLQPRGRLVASTDNPRDSWLHNYLKEHFGKTTVLKEKKGMCYVSTRGDGEQKQKCFDSEFAFRDGDRLVKCFSRPGVFSHRRIDAGARALIRSLDLLEANFEPQQIIEMGSGCGAVAIAAALRYPQSQVLAVDSHARATESTERTAQLNGVSNVEVLLTSDGKLPRINDCDLFLCNPPYYSDFRISELFLQSAADSLRENARIHLVTKLSNWHESRMMEIFDNVERQTIGAYDVLISTQA